MHGGHTANINPDFLASSCTHIGVAVAAECRFAGSGCTVADNVVAVVVVAVAVVAGTG